MEIETGGPMKLFVVLIAIILPTASFAYPQGTINRNVRQSNIHTTVCVPNWTDTIRPSWSYTNRIKKLQMKELGLPGTTLDYQEDHIISLSLGGHPKDIENLYPQPWAGPNGAHAKDVVERRLHRQLCAGTITLEQARQRISAWQF